MPRYLDEEESDAFILSGAEDLVPVPPESGAVPLRRLNGVTHEVRSYRPRIEGLFARIERWTEPASGKTHWRSISRDNITTLYGRTDESCLADPSDGKARLQLADLRKLRRQRQRRRLRIQAGE
jgi:hypothetical protein